MPHGARRGRRTLALCRALALSLALGVPLASAQSPQPGQGGAAGPWIDPPARKPDAGKPAAEAAQSATVAPPTPAAASKDATVKASTAKASTAKGPAARATSAPGAVARRPPSRPVALARREAPGRKRIVTAPRARREAVAPHIRTAHPRRMIAAMPKVRRPPDEGVAGFNPYGAPLSRDGQGFAFGYADERLERLRAAQAAGYLIVRRRSVEFPDGRSLRTYRPDEDGGYD